MKQLNLLKKDNKKEVKKEVKPKRITAAKVVDDVGISIESFNSLVAMYKLRSYTGYEDPLRNYIMEQLDNMAVPYVIYNGNLIGLNHDNAPLLSAHMDMVNTDHHIVDKNKEYDYTFTITENYDIRIFRKNDDKEVQTSLGADDKNGVWIILELLKAGKPINFIFSHGEEGGCVGIKQVVSNVELAKDIEKKSKYALIVDRRNSSDIIGYGNSYCVALDDKLEEFSKANGYKFKKAHGLCSDADYISKLVECVNLSTGYYQAHSSSEFTNVKELVTTLNFVSLVVDEFVYSSVSGERMREFKKCGKPYSEHTEEKKETKETTNNMKGSDAYKNYINKIYGQPGSIKEYSPSKSTNELVSILAYSFSDVSADSSEDILDMGTCPMCGESLLMSTIDNDVDHETYKKAVLHRNVEYVCSECGESFYTLLEGDATLTKRERDIRRAQLDRIL
jgi:5-methylcytosine-specific restriction endonuclease McrA